MANISRLLLLLTLLTLLAGCGSPSAAEFPAASGATADTPTASAPEATVATAATVEATQQAVPAADLAALCPQAGEGTALYVSTENGFCFLYPADLKLQPDPLRPAEAVLLVGPLAEPGAMETVALNVTVANNGPADGLDSAGYAAAWLQYNMPAPALAQTPGREVAPTPATLGGQPATVLDNLPGMMANLRGAFVVAGGVKYQVTMLPLPQDVPQLADAATQAWDTVTGSIVFFPPQNTRIAVRAADVCPDAADDTKLLVDEVSGYCLLYPADFAIDPELPTTIAGGPELGPYSDFAHVRASLSVGTYPLGQMTPEQALQPPVENSDPNSTVPATLGGHPAVTYDFVAGPWRQRNAVVVVDGRVFTFVAQPWDPELFPQALPDVERLWNTASSSIAFFDPWR
ncbi:MAG: hypothetical protein U0X20_14955 [Caldilineaceae bacterium]